MASKTEVNVFKFKKLLHVNGQNLYEEFQCSQNVVNDTNQHQFSMFLSKMNLCV